MSFNQKTDNENTKHEAFQVDFAKQSQRCDIMVAFSTFHIQSAPASSGH